MTDVWPSQKHLPLIGDSCIEQISLQMAQEASETMVQLMLEIGSTYDIE
jgi:hypothetical protein